MELERRVLPSNPGSSTHQVEPKLQAITKAAHQAAAARKKPFKGLFTKDLKHMMYAFGDSKTPSPDTVDLLEDIVIEYITEMTLKATTISTKRGKLQLEDLVFLVRKDKKKFARVKELLSMYEELKRARRAFELEGEKI